MSMHIVTTLKTVVTIVPVTHANMMEVEVDPHQLHSVHLCPCWLEFIVFIRDFVRRKSLFSLFPVTMGSKV